MTPHNATIALLLFLVGTLGIVACGGGDDDEDNSPGNLTNPRQVPTATINPSPEPPVIIDPNAIQPLPAVGTPQPTPAPSGESTATPAAGTCGPTYTLVSGDTFSLIAEKCGKTTQELVDANPEADPRGLRPGDVINIPQ
jgi:hypothetical protein